MAVGRDIRQGVRCESDKVRPRIQFQQVRAVYSATPSLVGRTMSTVYTIKAGVSYAHKYVILKEKIQVSPGSPHAHASKDEPQGDLQNSRYMDH